MACYINLTANSMSEVKNNLIKRDQKQRTKFTKNLQMPKANIASRVRVRLNLMLRQYREMSVSPAVVFMKISSQVLVMKITRSASHS